MVSMQENKTQEEKITELSKTQIKQELQPVLFPKKKSFLFCLLLYYQQFPTYTEW